VAVSDGPYFFMSYARADRERSPADLRRFYDTLSEIIAVRTGTDTPGFLDTADMEPGVNWPDSLREALRTAKSFVPLLSPKYFGSQYCGKEWTAFSRRIAASEPAVRRLLPMPEAPGLIQPVLYVRPEDLAPLPSVVRPVMYKNDRYPDVYGERGLQYLLTLPNQDNEYRTFVHELAESIIRAVRARPLPTDLDLPPLSQIQSAMHDPETQGQDVTVERSAPGTHLFAQFVYIAARSTELDAVRQLRSAYGELGGLDWRPYLPDQDREVGMIAQQIAGRERFRYEVLDVDENLIDRIADANASNKVVVIIVDPWTVRVERYRALMRALDERSFANSVVVIVVNLVDPETAQSSEALRLAIEGTFQNPQVGLVPYEFLPWISSAAEFEDGLARALVNAQQRIVKRREVARRAEEISQFTRPPVLDASPSMSAS